jgi:hypothetical protein
MNNPLLIVLLYSGMYIEPWFISTNIAKEIKSGLFIEG